MRPEDLESWWESARSFCLLHEAAFPRVYRMKLLSFQLALASTPARGHSRRFLTLSSAVALLGANVRAAAMDLGANFWNLGWHRPNDWFQGFRMSAAITRGTRSV